MRLLFPIVLGLAGCAILVGLGLWQLQRQVWKDDILARIEATIAADPVALPLQPDPAADAWRPVALEGSWTGPALRVLTTMPDLGGPGARIIAAVETRGRLILADLGYLPDGAPLPALTGPVAITGNLSWPDEVDSFTPPPEGDLWFARDVPAMAAALGTEPVMVVARDLSPPIPGMTPLPIDTAAIPNNHTEYAITWFLMAAVWAAMSGLLIRRQSRRT
jgi:surfeit locus 1 family protein